MGQEQPSSKSSIENKTSDKIVYVLASEVNPREGAISIEFTAILNDSVSIEKSKTWTTEAYTVVNSTKKSMRIIKDIPIDIAIKMTLFFDTLNKCKFSFSLKKLIFDGEVVVLGQHGNYEPSVSYDGTTLKVSVKADEIRLQKEMSDGTVENSEKSGDNSMQSVLNYEDAEKQYKKAYKEETMKAYAGEKDEAEYRAAKKESGEKIEERLKRKIKVAESGTTAMKIMKEGETLELEGDFDGALHKYHLAETECLERPLAEFCGLKKRNIMIKFARWTTTQELYSRALDEALKLNYDQALYIIEDAISYAKRSYVTGDISKTKKTKIEFYDRYIKFVFNDAMTSEFDVVEDAKGLAIVVMKLKQVKELIDARGKCSPPTAKEKILPIFAQHSKCIDAKLKVVNLVEEAVILEKDACHYLELAKFDQVVEILQKVSELFESGEKELKPFSEVHPYNMEKSIDLISYWKGDCKKMIPRVEIWHLIEMFDTVTVKIVKM